eukprot:TCALIF_08098-PB protein Name:"Similar to Gba Glucosylceramidase (Mus musculus)" AED:0.13 eAED:0.13 QI:29/0.92/0.8/1/0.92/0.93/15/0/1019
MHALSVVGLLLVLGIGSWAGNPCIRKDFHRTSFVCVCNSTYCDDYEPLSALPPGQVLLVSSDKLSKRLESTVIDFVPLPNSTDGRSVLTIDRSNIAQRITGWGGAFTDAAAINVFSVNKTTQDNIIKSYYSKNGLDYHTGRINMGSCDFSPRPYSYVDTPGDVDLTTFALQEEDLDYKIPLIKKALSETDRPLKLFGSPWTAPPWMKSNNDYVGFSHLLPDYYQAWANYFVKFLDAYKAQGIDMWGLTAQNEPTHGSLLDLQFNCMGWNASDQRKFIVENLGPALETAGYGDVKLMMLDDQRSFIEEWAQEVLEDPRAFEYVDGIALHWYADDLEFPLSMDQFHKDYPSKFILYSEACNGFGDTAIEAVSLGSWNRGEKYLDNIIEDLNHWAVGWTDWNIALDMEGGPNWAGKRADSPIIVNAAEDEFYKQPMYYALGHVTRYIPEGSFKIMVDDGGENTHLKFTAVERPDGGVALVLMNRDLDLTRSVTIVDPDFGSIDLDVEPSSMHTLVIMWLKLGVALAIVVGLASAAKPCVPREFHRTSFVCVCNSTFCDEADPVEALPVGQVLKVTTDKIANRFTEVVTFFNNGQIDENRPQLVINRDEVGQQIKGWGGAFTDSAAINIASLNRSAQDLLVEAYFAKTGLDYNIGRVNIGGCDFSTRPYTYVDTPGDVDLETFALAEEDTDYKIPLIKKAESVRGKKLKLFASPWTAPPWMKTNNDYTGIGYLKTEYYSAWANYFVKFLDDYKREVVQFWGLTAQNEPLHGSAFDFKFNCMGWNASQQRIFVVNNLGPALELAGYGDLQLMVFDDQRSFLSDWADEVMSDPKADAYIDGFAVHWYLDNWVDLPFVLNLVHEKYPNKFILYSEACNGDVEPEDVSLGSWNRGEKYLHNILENINYHVVGWTDWNLALDLQGGPNWAGNFVDAPIIVNPEAGEFYKQPMYYALGHVTRFMPEGSFKIQVNEVNGVSHLTFAAVERPDGGVALTLMNRDLEIPRSIVIVDPEQGYLDVEVAPSSMH